MYAGFDVSDKTTQICVVDTDGAVPLASDPDVIAKWLGKQCPGLVRAASLAKCPDDRQGLRGLFLIRRTRPSIAPGREDAESENNQIETIRQLSD
jgi:hypothetical protein